MTHQDPLPGKPGRGPKPGSQVALILVAALLVGVSLSGCLTPGGESASKTQGPRVQGRGGSAEAPPASPTFSPRPLRVEAGEDLVIRDQEGKGAVTVQLRGSVHPLPEQVVVGQAWYEDGVRVAEGNPALVAVAPGNHTFMFEVSYLDASARGVSNDTLRVVVLGNLPPRVQSGPYPEVWDGDGDGREKVALNATGSKDPDGTMLSYDWRLGGRTILASAAGLVELPIGVHHIELLVRDGVTTATSQVKATVHPNRPPLAVAGPDQIHFLGTGQTQLPVRLEGAGSDPEGLPLSFAWESASGSSLAQGRFANLTLREGTHSFVFVARDAGGKTTASTVSVQVVSMSLSLLRFCELLECAFTAIATGAKEPVSYQWQFGDGAQGTGQNPRHTYAGGAYTVRVDATDALGRTSSKTLPITVFAGPPTIAKMQFNETVTQVAPPAAFFASVPPQATLASLGILLRTEGIDMAWVEVPEDTLGRPFKLTSTGGDANVWFLDECTPRGTIVEGGVFRALGPDAGIVPAGARCALLAELQNVPSNITLNLEAPVKWNLAISSPAFQAGQSIPYRFGCKAAGMDGMFGLQGTFGLAGPSPLSSPSPPLSITVPHGIKHVALTLEDQIAPTFIFVHWVAWNIPVPASGRVEIPAGSLPPGSAEGTNNFGGVGYGPVCGFPLTGTHRFVFTLRPLGEPLELPSSTTYNQLVAAIAQRPFLGSSTLTATYQNQVCDPYEINCVNAV